MAKMLVLLHYESIRWYKYEWSSVCLGIFEHVLLALNVPTFAANVKRTTLLPSDLDADADTVHLASVGSCPSLLAKGSSSKIQEFRALVLVFAINLTLQSISPKHLSLK